MNFKTTILLLVLLVGIGAYLAFTRLSSAPSSDQPAPTAAAQGTKLLDLTADDVAQISIKPASGAEIALKKSGTVWKLTAPVAAPADSAVVSQLASAIVELRSTGQLSADQKAAAGLDQPPYTVELTDKSGKATTIAFGSKPAFGDALDVILNNRDHADVVSAGVYTQLEQPASAYRLMQLVSIPVDKISGVKIFQSDSPVVVLEKAGSVWQLSTESADIKHYAGATAAPMNADGNSVGDITRALGGLTAKQFVDEQHPLAYFGLSKPSMSVWFSGPGTSTTILFGRAVDVSKADVYASVNGQVVTLPSVTADAFKKSPLELRDKTVLDIDPASVTSIQVVADRAPEARALGPNTAPAWNMTYERKQESHITGPPLPTTGPAPAAAPAKSASHWNVISGMRVGEADDAKVDAMLQLFHPLTAQKYIASTATTMPASTYTLTIKANPNRTENIKILDQGGDNPLIGSHADAIFELDRTLLPKINGDTTSK